MGIYSWGEETLGVFNVLLGLIVTVCVDTRFLPCEKSHVISHIRFYLMILVGERGGRRGEGRRNQRDVYCGARFTSAVTMLLRFDLTSREQMGRKGKKGKYGRVWCLVSEWNCHFPRVGPCWLLR